MWEAAQRRLGVKVDGDDGPLTWGALLGLVTGRPGHTDIVERGKALARHPDLQTAARIADFLANTSHESQDFRRGRENMNYTTTARIIKMWPTRFRSEAAARPYVSEPEKLANYVYARPSEGNVRPGDGWRYRGGGDLQVTFLNGYRRASEDAGVDLVAAPERITEPRIAILTALGYYRRAGLWALVDAGRTTACRAKLNTGDPTTPRARINGMDDVDARRRRVLTLFQ